eukprot:gene28891-32083_t
MSIFKGCVPVVLGNGLFQPFEPHMDWTQFSVQVRESQIPKIDDLLDEVVDGGRLESMQSKLHCVAQHLAYSSLSGSFMGESGKFDAFETIMEILRMKSKFPKAMPFEYYDLDPEYVKFMDCQEPSKRSGMNLAMVGRGVDAQAGQRQRVRAGAGVGATSAKLCSHSSYAAVAGEPYCSQCPAPRGGIMDVLQSHRMWSIPVGGEA